MGKAWLKSYSPGTPELPTYSGKRLDQFLDETSKEFPDKKALTFYEEEVTFEELRRLSHALSSSLFELGVEKGDRVAILLPNSIQFAVSFYGILRAGAVPLPINPLYTKRELNEVFEDARPKAVISLRTFSFRIKEAAKEAGTEILIFTRLEKYLPPPLSMLYRAKNLPKDVAGKMDSRNGQFEIKSFEKLVRSGKEFERVEVDPKKDLAVLMYTSGTTGRAKGVRLTHQNLVSNLDQIKTFSDPVLKRGGEIQLGVLPFFHIYGLNFILNLSVREGYEVVLFPKFSTKQVCRAVGEKDVTIVAGVPAIFSAFYKEYERTNGGVDFSSLKFLGSGAAPCPVSVIEKMKKITSACFIEAYGLTETSPITHMNPPLGKQKAGSIGVPLPGTSAKIVDPKSGDEVEPGVSGELLLKGPQVFESYWENEEATEKVFLEGWLRTKDVARMDEEGYFFIEGRLDDMINVSGKKVWPQEIEEILIKHPHVEEAAVVGVPDKKSGQAPKAFVVPSVKPLDRAKVVEFCHGRLVDYKVPKEIDVVTDIPKSAMGKTLHYVLRDGE